MLKTFLHGKNALITGGSKGIGKAMCLSLAKNGVNVFFTYSKDDQSAQTTYDELKNLNVEVYKYKINLTSFEEVNFLVENAISNLKKIDIIINNVGVTTRSKYLDVSEDEFDRVLITNLKSPFFLTQKISKHMIEHKIKGSIINISSLSAIRSISRMSHYQASKAALCMFTKSIAFELAPYGIRANTVLPGLTKTSANSDQWLNNPHIWQDRESIIPLQRSGVPDDFAGIAMFLASDMSSWITGASIIIDGGQSTI